MPRVTVVVDVPVTVARVWRALTEPAEVRAWDGVVPVAVPDGYPAAGQHALWGASFGPLRLTLHDRIREVESQRALVSSIDVGFVHVEERYTLDAVATGTRLVSDNEVSARVPGLRWLAVRLTDAAVRSSMARLVAHCQTPG